MELKQDNVEKSYDGCKKACDPFKNQFHLVKNSFKSFFSIINLTLDSVNTYVKKNREYSNTAGMFQSICKVTIPFGIMD